jgi:hypothetical protein
MTSPELGEHISFPFDSDAATLSFTAGFVANGIRRHHRVVLITHALAPADLHALLAPRVPAFAAAVDAGQVLVLPATAAQLLGGSFDPDRMVTDFDVLIARTRQDGYAGLWVSADMSWATPDVPGVERLFDFEAASSARLVGGPVAAVCQYDRRLFDAAFVDQACARHPLTPGQAPLRFAANAGPGVLVMSGEADLTNREALAAVLDPLAGMEDDVTVDAAAVRFADAGAAQLLARLAWRRAGRRTEIRCSPAIDRLLRAIGADNVAQVTIEATYG